VQLTEDLAEKLTPEKDQVEEADRINVLQTLAESLMLQGNYHLATKKFTQAVWMFFGVEIRPIRG
jgi:intraflagellar transport protein 140